MTPGVVRRVVAVVCVLGVGGMIAGSVADNNGVALTAGLVTAAASLCLMAVTAVSGAPPAGGAARGSDALGAEIEDRVHALVAAGGDEGEVRALVRAAVALGRTRR